MSQFEFFIPAETIAEAIQRIHALTGSSDTGRGEKRAVVALRDALNLDVDIVRTNAKMGEKIAEALGIEWNSAQFTTKTKLNLDGLNQLLFGATLAYREGRLNRVISLPYGLVGPEWELFNPARNKLEAVTRIASLTGAPRESLGPGSKERKSVLINLADALFPDINQELSKTRLAESLAQRLGMQWSDSCFSTGETISLDGLNLILAGTERKLGMLGATALTALDSAAAEGDALAWALRQGLDEFWDGKASIQWMADNGIRGANDNEWQGFFFEAKAREILGANFVPPIASPKVKYGNTLFDYSLNRVWDLKAHTALQIHDLIGPPKKQSGSVILNDAAAIRACADEQGIGFLILSGSARMDFDGSFVAWHRKFKGKPSTASNSGKSRMRKAAFMPISIESFWIENTQHFQSLIVAGQIKIAPQGRQAPRIAGMPGSPRADKIHMNISASRGNGFKVAGYEWP